MLRHFSKLLTLKYSSANTSDHSATNITLDSVNLWLKELRIGLDAVFDDRLLDAEDILISDKSLFHAFGYAILIYMRAMLALEKPRIEEAIEYVLSIEIDIKKQIQYFHKRKRKTTPASSTHASNIHTSCSVPLDIHAQKVSPASHNSLNRAQEDYLEMHFELIHASCILMIATLQFLCNNWIDNAKAAYELRKAYKIYERLFETVHQMSLADYELVMQQKYHGKPSLRNTRRTMSHDDTRLLANDAACHDTIEQGACFGIGLFNLIISLLPSRVSKVLNSLGLHSSRRVAIQLLSKSYNSQTMYSSLSSFVLLLFYTNAATYIHPRINRIISFKDAKSMLQKMKLSYPNGRVWHLIEGRFKRIQGKTDDAMTLFKRARELDNDSKIKSSRRSSERFDVDEHFRIASVNEFTQFRSFATYETGWTYIYAGDYLQASESFFCLESMCNWSRLFYHYISTCCMISQGMYEKSVLEMRQLANLFDQRRKLGGRISSNEYYAEVKLKAWVQRSKVEGIALKEILSLIANPVWELIYLWNGIHNCSSKVIESIKRCYASKHEDPLICLIMGVIYRDIDDNAELAMECFNLALQVQENWTCPYAMYEIAATQCLLLLKSSNCKVIVADWIRCIEDYYQQHAHDKEWEHRMQLKCQLLLESCT